VPRDGYAAGSQRAYTLGSCDVGQTDGRIAESLNAPMPPHIVGRGIKILADRYASYEAEKPVIRRRHLAKLIELSVRGGHAALCRITLTVCLVASHARFSCYICS